MMTTKTTPMPARADYSRLGGSRFSAVNSLESQTRPIIKEQTPPILDMELVEQVGGRYELLIRSEDPAVAGCSAIGRAAIAAVSN